MPPGWLMAWALGEMEEYKRLEAEAKAREKTLWQRIKEWANGIALTPLLKH